MQTKILINQMAFQHLNTHENERKTKFAKMQKKKTENVQFFDIKITET